MRRTGSATFDTPAIGKGAFELMEAAYLPVPDERPAAITRQAVPRDPGAEMARYRPFYTERARPNAVEPGRVAVGDPVELEP